MTFNEELKELVLSSKLSVTAIAGAAGVSRTYLYEIMAGRYAPTIKKFADIAAVLLKDDPEEALRLQNALQTQRTGSRKRPSVASKGADFLRYTLQLNAQKAGYEYLPLNTDPIYRNAGVVWLPDCELLEPILVFNYAELPDLNTAYGLAVRASVETDYNKVIIVYSEPLAEGVNIDWVSKAHYEGGGPNISVRSNFEFVEYLRKLKENYTCQKNS